MLRTIQIGTCTSVQGVLVRQLADGRVVIRVDDRTYEGVPVARSVARPEAVAAAA